VRNLPVAASVGWRHLGRDRVHATLIVLRALPTVTRRRLANRAIVGTPSPTAALTLAADGRRQAALRVLDEAAARSSTPRQLRRLVAAAVALDDPARGQRVLDRLEDGDRDRARLEALVQARQGNLVRAEYAATSAGWRAGRLRRRLAGELAALRPQAPGPPAGRDFQPRPGCVLHLVTNALPEVTAGYTVRTQGIVAAQLRAGLDSHVATRLGFPVTAGHLATAADVRVDDVPYHRLLPLRWLPGVDDRLLDVDIDQTAKLVERLRPAVLHAHSKYTNARVALALGARFGLPVVYEIRGFLEETWRSRGGDERSDAYQLARHLETWCMSSADAVVTLAENMKAEIVARGIAPDDVLVVPNAVDDAFLDVPPDPAALRRSLGVAPEDVVVGVISTLNDYEGVDTLIDAVALLRRRWAAVRLLVVGDGPALNDLRERVQQRDLRDAAIFTGRVPFAQIRTFHAAIDVFCVPRADTPVTRLVTPLKPLEAMATGRPVVVSDLAPLREIVETEHTGTTAAPGDPESLAHALQPLLYDPTDRKRMGGAARQWVAEHRTWAIAARRYRDLYARLGGA
jgi:glycosyltransferase involved in cell wall biosynthesis